MISSILKIYYRPQEAFRELQIAPPLGLAVLLFLAVTAAASFLAPIPESSRATVAKAAEMFPILKHLRLVAFGYTVIAEPIFPLLLQGAARMIGGQGSVKTFLTLSLLIHALFAIPAAALTSVKVATMLLTLWQIVLSCWALALLNGFTAGKTIGAYILGLLGLMVVYMGGCGALVMNSGLREKLLQKPNLVRVHYPAHYDWTFKTLAGKEVSFETFRGKVVVLNRWATWCGPCRYEMPSLQRLHDLAKPLGVVVAAVSNEDSEKVKKFVQDKGYTIPVFVASQFPPVFESASIPTTFILSRSGEIAAMHNGAAKWDDPAVIDFVKTLMRQ